jgi:phosphoadenosine phosphosulfate reductase
MPLAPAIDQTAIDELNARFEFASPEAILDWAMAEFGDSLAVGASFGGPTGMVLLHMLAQRKPDVFVFVLDTSYLFEETYDTMRRSIDHLGLMNVNVFRPRLSHEEQAERHGAALWMRDPDACCEIRKVEPNHRALEGKRAWVSGLRRDQSEGRADTPIISWNTKFGLVKINPLANWDEKQIWAYIVEHKVPYNPLLDQGYTSIGCYNCTLPGVQGRAGRWQGFDKDECGLHT